MISQQLFALQTFLGKRRHLLPTKTPTAFPILFHHLLICINFAAFFPGPLRSTTTNRKYFAECCHYKPPKGFLEILRAGF